jgi:xanthine dehydrogenase YagR molybdenum-binding subunit
MKNLPPMTPPGAATRYIGVPTSRVDGRMKVTGTAKYAAEYNLPGLVHGFVITSAIARGRIRQIDTRDALAVDGVLDVITHENRPKLARSDDKYHDEVAPPGIPYRPLYDDKIRWSGQPVALVVAENLETARYAASFVQIEYQRDEHVTDVEEERANAYVPPEERAGVGRPAEDAGDAAEAFAQAEVRIEAEYRTPIEHHNPMETNATTAVWEGDGQITVFDKTQGVKNSQRYVANIFGYAPDKVHVMAPYVGGAFGLLLRPGYQLVLAVMAARALKRSVRVTLTRQQMFTFAYRPATVQRLALGVRADGTLVSWRHDAIGITSRHEDYQDPLVNWSRQLYACPASALDYRLVKLDLATPCDMRAPGGAPGVYAIECAMDELAYAAGIDPLELRLKNYSDKDQAQDKPYTSKELRECYRQGAEKFGWSKRSHEPRSMRDGRELVGWGMATGIWEAMQMKAGAKVALGLNGDLELASAFADIGTGTYTMAAQVAAEMLGVPLYNVTTKLSDSKFPDAPVEGGSWTAASLGSAVQQACQGIRSELLRHAQEMDASPLAGCGLDDVAFVDGQIRAKDDPARAVAIADAMRAGGAERITQEATAEPSDDGSRAKFAHSAIFAEVRVDEELGVIRVTRVVNAVAAGRIINPKTAGSQIMGAVVGGIGMALHEETLVDHALGRPMNHNLAEYHVPVNADVHDIEVIFVEERDELINPLGVKGVGEIGIVGTAAAIANAVFHATGKRVRDLPITLDKVMGE